MHAAGLFQGEGGASLTFWPQLVVAGTMALTLFSVEHRTRDDDPVERLCALGGTVVIVGMMAIVLNAAGFWDALTR